MCSQFIQHLFKGSMGKSDVCVYVYMFYYILSLRHNSKDTFGVWHSKMDRHNECVYKGNWISSLWSWLWSTLLSGSKIVHFYHSKFLISVHFQCFWHQSVRASQWEFSMYIMAPFLNTVLELSLFAYHIYFCHLVDDVCILFSYPKHA